MQYTLIVTSCNRFDLLKQTLRTFFFFADVLPSKMVIHEDSGLALPSFAELRNFEIINGPSGQIEGIDKCIKAVNTDFFFHLEDDWVFTRNGFINESLKALEDKNCICHWLRARNDTNGHPVKNGKLVLNHMNIWHGFTFNPTLKRKSDYPDKGYSKFSSNNNRPWECEASLGLYYKKKGMYASISESPYVLHTGGNRHVNTFL